MGVYINLKQSGIHIDLITWIFEVPESLQEEVTDNICQHKEGSKKKPTSNYKHRVRIPIPTNFKQEYLDTGAKISYLNIEYAPTQKGIDFMRVSIYPTRINLKEAHKILESILFPLDDPISEILLNSKITELDLAIDLIGKSINDLMFEVKGKKFEEVITTDSKTIYLGNRKKSSNCWCIYDKSHKLSKQSDKGKGNPITRIEYKRRGQKIPSLKDLMKSKNPFRRLSIFQYPLGVSKDDVFNILLASARLEGIKNSLGRIKDADLNKKYTKMFAQNKILNWDGVNYKGKSFWTTLGIVIESITNPK